MDLHPSFFCLSFYLLYFFLPPFEGNGLPFWVPDVLCQHSEVVLWNLFGVQMFFWWICGGESGLPILVLCHLRIAPFFPFKIWLCRVLVAACGIFGCSLWTLNCGMWYLVPWPGIKPRLPASGAWSLRHWTTREFHHCFSMNGRIPLFCQNPKLV